MKAVFVSHDGAQDISGVLTWMQRVLPHLAQSGVGIEAHLFRFGDAPGVTQCVLEAAGITCRTAPWPADTPTGVGQCLRWLEESRPDVYVPNSVVPAYFAARFARESGAATIAVLHSDDPVYHGIVDEFVAGSPPWRVTAVVGVSGFLAELARRAAPRLPVASIPCGVPLDAAQPVTHCTPGLRLVCVGRVVEEQKRATATAQALAAAIDRWEDTFVGVIGDGPALPAVRQVLARHIAVGKAELSGRLPAASVMAHLRKFNVFVLLSDYEGLPVALLEAMSLGLVPVCLALRSGIGEVIRDGTNGLLVRDRGPGFLAALERLRDPTVRQQMGERAVETVRSRYQLAACGQRWLEFLREVAPGPGWRSTNPLPSRFRLPAANPLFGDLDRRPVTLFGRIMRKVRGRLASASTNPT